MGVEERVVVLLNVNLYAQNYNTILPQTIPTIFLILKQVTADRVPSVEFEQSSF
jgi:hypothetical protein